MDIKKNQSDAFWQVKAIAIFSIFFAHMPGHMIDNNSWMINLFDIIGMVGVPIFLLVSGFFYKGKNTAILKTMKSLLIPLSIWGTICYVFHIIKTPTDHIFLDWCNFVFGSETVFYFVPMLFCCMILSRYINNIILICIGLISQSLTTYTSILPYNEIWNTMMNPFNFIPFFAIGNIIRQYNILDSINKMWYFIFILTISIFLIYAKPHYDFPFTIIFTVSSFFLIYQICLLFTNNAIIIIGKMSFVIYLSHIQIAGAIQSLFKPLWGTYLEPTKIIIAFTIATSFCLIVKSILDKVQLNQVSKYLGYR